MRRFDPGHLAAKQKIEEGLIGEAVVFKSTSRDPFPPPDEYVNPDVCGGFLIDSGIHDFDSARWLFGEIDTVHAIGGALVVDVFKKVGDVDNAIVSLKFTNGKLGVIDLSVHATYGYDISTDILGAKGAIRIGYLRETPILTMTENNIGHDVVQLFDNRFAEAYVLQLQNFAENVLNGRRPPVTIDDGIEALRVALAAEHSLRTGQPVKVSSMSEDVI
jgi:predicted dehydrogenase